MLSVEWAKNTDGDWYALDAVPVLNLHAWGVYVIWATHPQARRPATVLKVGSGNIGVRLAIERMNPELRSLGTPLFVTWAVVADHHHPAIVRYLSAFLHPVLPQYLDATVEPLAVNLPLLA